MSALLLNKSLDALVGEECWGLIASAGGRLLLKFGEKIPKHKPGRNLAVTEDERIFEGAFSLFVECAWRLDTPTLVLCVWSDPVTRERPLPEGIECLRGLRLLKAELSMPAHDLELWFEGDRRLKVFCDQSSGGGARDNYTVFSAQGAVSVGRGGVLSYEPVSR